MVTVELRVLGPVEADVDGEAVALGPPQRQAVLAALAVDPGRVVRRDTLIDRLWPDDPPSSAVKVLQKHVSGLRTSLGADAIETSSGGYRLAIEPGRLDVGRFEQAIEAAAAATDEHRRASALERATAEWRGTPFSGCSELPFVLDERTRLVRMHVECRLDGLTIRLGWGDTATAIPELERLAVEHPEHDGVAAALMRGLYVSDRPIEALRAFRRHERHLREELGVDPSPGLAELEGRILRHDPSLRPADPPGAMPTDAPGEVVADREIRTLVVVVVRDEDRSVDPDELLDHHDVLSAEVSAEVDRHGGVVERARDGEVVVCFGVPASEHDRHRAEELAEAIARRLPASRIGVAAGEAIVEIGDRVSIVAGKVLDEARALAVAPGRPSFAADIAASEARIETASQTDDFVGRHAELRTIADAWERVLDDRGLRVVEIVGDAGVGKTQLIAEALRRLDPAPARVIELGFSPVADVAFLAAFRTALTRLAADHPSLGDWLDSLGLPRREARALDRALARLVEPVGDTLPATEDWFGPVVRLIGHLSEHDPVVLVIEDLHWVRTDDAAAWLELAATDLADRPVLSLLTRRPDPPTPELDPRAVRERTRLGLVPLSPADSELLVAKAGHDLPAAARRLVVERAGGHPLFLLQYVGMLRDHPGGAADGPPPETARRVIAARLDHLPVPLRQAVLTASVLTGPMDAATLAAVAGTDEAATDDAARELVRAGLFRRLPRRDRSGTTEYAFQHVVVADVANRQLTRARRIELHRRAAEVLDARPDLLVDDVQALAWHRWQVVELAVRRGGSPDPDDRRMAGAALIAAGDLLLHLDAQRAIAIYRRALRLAPEHSTERARLLMRLGRVTTDAGRFDEAQAHLAEAGRLFDAHGEPTNAAKALAQEARAWWYVGAADRTDALLREAFSRLEGEPPSRANANVLVIAATQLALRGRSAEALELATGGLPVVDEHGTAEDSIRLLHARGQARFDLGDAGGTADLRRSLDEALAGGFGRLASQSYNNLAMLVWAAEGPEHARSLTEAGLELAAERGFLGQVPWHEGQLCELHHEVGDWDAVEAASARGLAVPVVAWVTDAYAARCRFWRGDDTGLDDLLAAIDAARPTRERQVLGPMLSTAVAAHAANGRHADAAALADELIELMTSTGHLRLREAGEAVRGLVRIGRLDLARSLVGDDVPTILRRRLMFTTGTALIAEAEGRLDEAGERFAAAEAEWARFPHPYEAARAAQGVGRVARRQGDTAGASSAIDRARSRFATLGADRCLRDLAAESP